MLTVLLVPAGTRDPMGWLIKAAQHDGIVHVALDFGDGYAVAMEFCGCWIRPSSYYSNPAIIRYPLALTASQEAAARAWLYQQVGSAYAYGQLLADGLELHHLPGLDERDGHTCSSLIAQALHAAGAYPFGDKPPAEVTPSDFHHLAEETPV